MSLSGVSVALALVVAYYVFQACKHYGSQENGAGESAMLYDQDPQLGYRLKPNLRFFVLEAPKFVILTDDRGARVGDEPLLDPERPQIIAAGCSFTFGLRVQFEDSFAGRLGQALHRDVLNAGVSGFSTISSKLNTERFLSLKPKVVVYGLIDDHFHRNLIPCTRFWKSKACRPSVYLSPDPASGQFKIVPPISTAGFVEQEEFSQAHPFGLKDVFWAMQRDWARATGAGDGNAINAATTAKLPKDAELNAMTFALEDWLRLAELHKFELVTAYIPDPKNPRPLSPEKQAVMEKLRRNPRFHFVDSSPRFVKYLAQHPGESLCVAPDDCHPGKNAHGLIAAELEPVVRKLLAQ